MIDLITAFTQTKKKAEFHLLHFSSRLSTQNVYFLDQHVLSLTAADQNFKYLELSMFFLVCVPSFIKTGRLTAFYLLSRCPHTFAPVFYGLDIFLNMCIKINQNRAITGRFTQFHWFWQSMHAEIGRKRRIWGLKCDVKFVGIGECCFVIKFSILLLIKVSPKMRFLGGQSSLVGASMIFTP
jgi:hypothetical protein